MMNEKKMTKVLDLTIKAAIVLLAAALLWFAFIYYPKVVGKFKSQAAKGGLVSNVGASSKSLPYQNGHFKIEYSAKQNAYLVIITAETLDQYNQYKSESELTLKNILSMDKLCGLNVVYSSNFSFVKPQTGQRGCS